MMGLVSSSIIALWCVTFGAVFFVLCAVFALISGLHMFNNRLCLLVVTLYVLGIEAGR